MELNKANLDQNLHAMLEALADAHFVAFDLEFSGISTRAASTNKAQTEDGALLQSIQERYADTKAAAEKYQILQAGFTIVQHDANAGYTLKPFNMFLSPLVGQEKLQIERVFSFNSASISFLLKHDFSIAGPFMDGVPYLSRDEERIAIANEARRADKLAIEDINLTADDTENLLLMRTTRLMLNQWIKQNQRPTPLVIGSKGHKLVQPTGARLNGYQKRLIHQLIRADYPGLSSWPAGGNIHVTEYNQQREESEKASRLAEFQSDVQKQKGIRWFIEGMVRGDLSQVDAFNWFAYKNGKPVWVDHDKARQDFRHLQQKLKGHRTILVGHNIFSDLIYFYRTFFGPLPARVQDFAKLIHELFPLVIDTKYVATHENSNINAQSGLHELTEAFRDQTQPPITLDEGHNKYDFQAAAHEAGYDSFLTARLLIRQAAYIESLGLWYSSSDDEGSDSDVAKDFYTPPENAGAQAMNKFANLSLLDVPATHTSARSGGSPGSRRAPAVKKRKPKRCEDDLIFFSDEESEEESEKWVGKMFVPKAKMKARAQAQRKQGRGLDLLTGSPTKGLVPEDYIKETMPEWDSHFWTIYGNKLRVNGTLEGVLKLG